SWYSAILSVVAELPSPADLDLVRVAFRLGWAVSELRGRYPPDLFEKPEPGTLVQFTRAGDERPLPLALERKNQEVRIEIYEAIDGLIKALQLEAQAIDLTKLHEAIRALEAHRLSTQEREKRW